MGLKAHDTNFDRWVCVTPAAECDGTRAVYGERRPCPLYGKCKDDPRNKYEFPLMRCEGKKKFPQLWPDGWRERHNKERVWMLRCFDREGLRAYRQAVQQKYYAQKNINRQAKRHKAYRDRDEKQVRSDAGVADNGDRYLRRILLPCGEDCEFGCPHDGVCPYTDEDEDQLICQEWTDRAKRDERNKKRMLEDVGYAEKMRAQKRAHAAKHRAKVKFIQAGGTPEEFEQKWMLDHQ